jgi:hypothetical protein
MAPVFAIFMVVGLPGVWSSQTSLATFNAGFVPFYPGVTGPEIEERVDLMIREVYENLA